MSGFSRTDPRAILDFTGILDDASDDFFRASNYVGEWTNVTASPGGFLAGTSGKNALYSSISDHGPLLSQK